MVVIAIFSLLATIVFVATRGVEERARISRGLWFSQHLLNSLGADAVGIWRFDEGSGTTANDMSGWHNHGTLQPTLSPPTWQCAAVDPNNTPSRRGCSLRFDGVNDFIQVPNSASLNPVHITMEMWVRFNTIPYTGQIALEKGGQYRLIAGDVNTERISIRYATTVTGWPAGTLIGNTLLVAGVWYHAVATYDGSFWRLYLNGQPDGSKAESGNLVSGTLPLFLGAISAAGGWPFNGLIDEVRIYATALPSAQIQSKYYAGLQNLLARGLISQEEYQQRMSETQPL